MNWISVKDKLPSEDGEYIVFDSKRDHVSSLFYDINKKQFVDDTGEWGEKEVYEYITYWMPLPKPPKDIK